MSEKRAEISDLSLPDAALAYATLGYKVFPIAPNKKAPPLIKAWQEKATNDIDQVQFWWAEKPSANIGLHCSGLNGKHLLVLDVDVKNNGEKH